jgi:DNA-binding NarL/FixJ family response regulator
MAANKNQAAIRILLVDDHEIVRTGVKLLLHRHADLRVVGEAGTAEEAVAAAARLKPDVVLLDLRLKKGTGIEACRAIRARLPGTRILILTAYTEEDTLMRAIQAGADGYVLKEINGQKLIEALREVAAGRAVLDRTATHRLMRSIRDGSLPMHQKIQQLSKNERAVMALVAEGQTNKEIAASLRLNVKTVKNYVSNILSKLCLERRSQVAVAYVQSRDPLPRE